MRKKRPSKEELIKIREYLDKWNLPIEVAEKTFYLCPSQKSYLLHQILIDDVIVEEKPITHFYISKVSLPSDEQLDLLKKLDDLCPLLRKNLRESLRKLRIYRHYLNKSGLRRYLYEKIYEHDICQENLEEFLDQLGYRPYISHQIMKNYDKYLEVRKKYEQIYQKHQKYLEEFNDFRKEHFEYDVIADKLVKANIGLINLCCKDFPFMSFNEDTFAVALEALAKAILYFDFEQNVKFHTFACTVIKRYLYRYISNTSIKGDSDLTYKYYPLCSENKLIMEEIALDEVTVLPEFDPIFDSSLMPMTFEDYEEIDNLEDSFFENIFYPEEYCEDDGFSLVQKEALKNDLQKILSTISEKERQMLSYHTEDLTLEEVSKRIGCSKQNIHCRLKRTLCKLLENNEEKLKDYLYDITKNNCSVSENDYKKAVSKIYDLRNYSFPVKTIAFFTSTEILSCSEKWVSDVLKMLDILDSLWDVETDYLEILKASEDSISLPLLEIICQIYRQKQYKL